MCTAIMILLSREDYNMSQVSLRDSRKFDVSFLGFGVNEDAIFNITYSKAVPSVKIKLILEFPNYPGKKRSLRGEYFIYTYFILQ